MSRSIAKIDHRLAANPYQSKYGSDWKTKIEKSPSLRLVRPVSDMIHHMAQETSNALKDTKYEGKALFYHDALSQLTEAKTIEWMEKNECEGRKLIDMWIRPVLGCNDEITLSNGKKTKVYAPSLTPISAQLFPGEHSIDH